MPIFFVGTIALGNVIGWLAAETMCKAAAGWKKSIGLLQMGIAAVTMALIVNQVGFALFLASTFATFAMYFILHKWVWHQ